MDNEGTIDEVVKMFGNGPHFHRRIADVADALRSVESVQGAVKALTVGYAKRDEAMAAFL